MRHKGIRTPGKHYNPVLVFYISFDLVLIKKMIEFSSTQRQQGGQIRPGRQQLQTRKNCLEII
jgi:hypothetical protein